MTKKLTPKQEKFCQLYIETGNASEAYRGVYNASKMKLATINRNAFELLQDSKISARVAELQNSHAKRHDITIDTITTMLLADRLLAREEKQSSAAVSASMGLAKIHGLIVDQVKTDTRSYVMGVERQKTEEEFERAYCVGVESPAGASDRTH